jgi:hypothetical protein
LIADDLEHQSFSEHGQCLALLSDILPEPCKNRCLENLLTVQALHRTTVYFSFYLFEVLNKFNRQEDLYSKLDFWKDLQKSGLKTPIETPEPSRSDCHAWGSHPLFHLYADIAGIRPAEANFRKVVISPKPYKLSWLKCEFPHHLGMLNMDLKFDFGNISGAITLPEGLTGELYWNSEKIVLNSGLNRLK